MKRKLLFITLLMLFCTTMFGQQHWTMSELEMSFYQNKISYYTFAKIDGVDVDNNDIQIAAFHGNELRGCAFPSYNGYVGKYIFVIDIYGTTSGDQIYFKLYKPDGNGGGVEYGSDFTINYNDEYVVPTEIPTIDFYNKHWNYEYVANEYMQYPCVIKIDGVLQERTNLELAAFCGEELRGVTRPQKENITEGLDIYMASLMIEGSNGETINFKLYDPTINRELSTDKTILFDLEYGNQNVVEIDFRNEAVAQIGSNYYATLQEALKAITSGCTLDILKDITITEKWDCRYTGAKITVPVTINGNGKTIKFTGEINDSNWNTLFRFEDVATVNNLTLDASAATVIQRGITFKTSVTVDNCTLIGNGTTARYAVIVGEGAGTAIGDVTANITNSTFKDWIKGVTDNMNGQDMKEFAITGCTFDNTDVIISAKEEVTFTGNTTDSDVQITSYTANNTLNVTAKNNNLATDGTYTVNAGGTLDLQDEFLTPVADVNGKIYFTLQDALNYAVTAADEVTVTLLDDINLEGKTWTPVYFNSYSSEGTNTLVIDGNNKTISNLSDMLFSGTWTGTKLEVKNLTISKANIKHDVEDANNVGVGAIVGNISATDEVVFNNVKLVESYVEGGHWTGGLIGYAAGYSGNDGPVFTDIVIENCEISGSTIVGKGSVGGVVGHATGDAWTSFGVETTKISNNTITSTGSSVNKAGIVMGTIGAAGQETTVNGETHTGGTFVSATVSNNEVKSHETTITTIYGRQGSTGGVLTLTEGGSYQNNPIEENVAYAVVAPGFKLEQNTNGTYGVVVDPEYGMQAKIVKDGTTTYYTTIADAITAAQPGETVTILDGEYTTDVTINKAITVVGERDEQGNNLVKITGRVSAYTGATVKYLNVNNTKTGDYDCALNVNGKDIVVDGVKLTGHNAMRYCYASGDITIKNSTINGSYFAVHFDGSEGGNIVFENTDITGWASYAGTVNSVSYTDCDFDKGSYSGHRYYNKNISFNECTFKDGLLIDLKASGSNVAFIDADMTVADVKALFKDPYYVANGNVTLNDVQVTYAASGYTANGSKYFDNLQDAINEVINGGYITVRSNIELTQGVTVPAGKKITLGLNGYTITGTPTEAAAFAVITNNGNLTIDDTQNGKILCNYTLAGSTSYAVNTITNLNGGVLTVEAGTIENKSTYASSNQIGYAIDNYPGATVVIKGGKVTASGSVYYDGIRQFCNSETLENNVTIEGGEVSTLWIQNPSDNNVTAVKGSFAITGGTLGNLYLEPSANFSGSISGGHVDSISRHQSGDNDIVSFITGGTFGMDVTEFCAFNYVCTQNTDGTYGIQYKPQQDNAFVIETLHELEAFRDAVNAGNDFSGEVFKLNGDINLAATRAINNWEPIGTQANPFKGTFDGGDNTISNLVAQGENNVGLFGYADNATIKNVKLENVNVKGTDCVGAIAGQVYSTSLIDNCHVSGLIQVEGQTNVGGIVGKYYTKVKNCSVIGDDVATSYVKGTYKAPDFEGDNIAGIMGHGGENNTFENNTVKNITISGTRKVAGIVGVTDQNTDVVNCLVENVNIVTTATAEYANSKKNSMSNGTLVGSYTTGNNTTGTVESCVVKDVNFLNPNNAVVSVGPITGGLRGGTDGMLAPIGVTASGNNIYMSTITGSNNLFLMNPVAKIGTTEYYTLFDAVAAVQDGETITMLRNTAEEFAIDNTTANITLDMAGFTLNGNIQPSEANLTIKNGTINNENASYSAIEINAGTLVLNDVKVTSKRHGVRIDGAVTATINGGEYRLSATSGTRHAVNVSGAANVTIKAGTFVGPAGTSMDSGSAVCVQSGATVTIEGGDFSGGKSATLGVNGTMIVTGGTYDQDVAAYCAEGYFCELNTTTNKYEVFRGLAGEGTEANPYLIKNLSDLTFFRDHVNEGGIRYNAEDIWVALEDNIDMASVDWSVNIGDDCNSTFDGIFDGKGYTLSNLNSTETAQKTDGYVCTGLFGAIYDNAVIKNFTIENVTINTGEFTGNNAAAVVGFAYNCKGSVENVKVTGNVNINAKNITGTAAIVGYDYYGKLTVKDCSVSANTGSVITGAAYVGGIVGYASSNSTLNKNTVENININATSCAAGGIAGIMLATGSADRNTVKNVTLTAGHENWQNSVAAIIGCMTNGSITVSNSTIENVTPSAVVGSEHKDHPTTPVAKVQARIGDKYYTTFVAALAAAQANETITLLDNVTLAETATIEKAITLDLKGMTVTGADGAIVFNVKAATTIKNGTIKGNKSGTSSGLIDIYANLNLNSVIVETSKINALRFEAGDCVATLEECNVTGAFKGYGGSVWEIKSGVYKASSTSINDQLNGTASISGGTFHYAIAEDECAPGYVVQNNGDGTWTVKYAPAAFVDANNNGTLDEGEAVYGNLDQIFAKHKEGDVYVVLTSNIVANAQVDTDADAHYHFTTNVAEGVTMDFLFADDWNYIQKMSLGQNITLNAKYLLAWTELNVSGTINTDYLYTLGAATTIEATGLVNANTGDATIQVKNNATFTVKGTVNTAILNVWVNNAKLIVDGGIVNANWVDIWDGAPVVTLQNSAQLNVANIKASRGGEIVVTDATLTATGSIELGHNAESAGKLTESGNSTINGEIKLTATGSTVASDGGLNVTTNIPDHKVVYENGEYKVVPCVYVAQVGDVKYESLQDAVNVGGNVTVLQNITLTEGIVIPADKTVTLDLAGYTVSQTKEQTSGYQMILNDGTLTIKDSSNEKTGKLSYTDSGNGGEYISDVIYNRSVLVIDGGTIENLSSATVATNGYPHAVDTYSGIRNTSVTINGGTIYCAEYSAIRMFCVSATYTADLVINEGAIVKGAIDMQNGTLAAALGTLTINGGTFETTKNANNIRFANWNGGATEYGITASVKGGFFKGGITTQYVPATADFNKHFITGGTFATDVNEYCHEYYDAIQGADNLWRVEQVLFAQTTALHQGWNWFSSYVNLSTPDGLEKLQTALGENGVIIKSNINNEFVTYEELPNGEFGWVGNEFSIYNTKMYMIETSNAHEMTVAGEVVDGTGIMFTLTPGWNWIGYPIDKVENIDVALSGLQDKAQANDMIKHRNDFAYFDASTKKWVGTLTQLEPGKGYKYKSNKSSMSMFFYTKSDAKETVVDNAIIDENYWKVESSGYANNMTITAMLSIDGEIVNDNYEIAAFANGECRGSARPIYVESKNAYMLFMTVFGDDVEELTFKYYDIDADTEYELSNVMNYSNDAIVGTIDNPYIFSMNILGIGENSIDNINIYPNPTTTDREINLQAICDKVEVFNALGVKVAEYHNVDTLDAFETAGIYVIRITNDNAVKHCRLVVK